MLRTSFELALFSGAFGEAYPPNILIYKYLRSFQLLRIGFVLHNQGLNYPARGDFEIGFELGLFFGAPKAVLSA
jgi:hypothetical protein